MQIFTIILNKRKNIHKEFNKIAEEFLSIKDTPEFKEEFVERMGRKK